MPGKFLISVIGPTAIGKTDLAIFLARHYDTEILSADSRQFYKEMNIGTAVPGKTELGMVRHHFVQHKSIFEPYSVGAYERDAVARLDHLFSDRNIVVLAGGSGLYVDAVCKGLDNFPPVSREIRSELRAALEHQGIESLQDRLKTLDPVQYDRIDLSNPHRLMRALEICIGTGKPYSGFLEQGKRKRSFRTIFIGLSADRETLYNRINERVHKMMEDGLLEEAKKLYGHRDLNALQTVGYKELFRYFDGEYSLEEAVRQIKKNTRRFAKRQLTWFRKNTDIHWVSHSEPVPAAIEAIDKYLIGACNEN